VLPRFRLQEAQNLGRRDIHVFGCWTARGAFAALVAVGDANITFFFQSSGQTLARR
jgi:hypothetical protein